VASSRLQQTINHFRQRLLDREATASQMLEYAYASVLQAIEPALKRLYDQMANELAQGNQISSSWLYEAQRLGAIKRLISGQISQFASQAMVIVARLQQDGLLLGLDAALALLDAQVPPGVNFSFGVPSMQALHNLIGATQAGSPLADLFRGFGEEAASAASKALIVGVAQGHGPRQIAPQVQQALGISRKRALVVSRDQLLHAYRRAQRETYKANSDVVTKYRRTAARSERTCAPCIALDGKLYDLDTEMPVHPGDRCTMVPVTKSWKEILSPLGIDTSGIPETRPQMQSGPEWFAKQDEATQRAILGNAKYEAWASGKFELSDLVKRTYDPDWGSSIQERPLRELVTGK
jgi:SPP1 gp7 family putative phage head morphogenesis protein